jgi:hypothetical protein
MTDHTKLGGLYVHLSLEELRRRIVIDPENLGALQEWFIRTQHVSRQAAREAERAQT